MERASSRAAAAAAAISALDLGRDLASACASHYTLELRGKEGRKDRYFTLFAYAALRVGFFFT